MKSASGARQLRKTAQHKLAAQILLPKALAGKPSGEHPQQKLKVEVEQQVINRGKTTLN